MTTTNRDQAIQNGPTGRGKTANKTHFMKPLYVVMQRFFCTLQDAK